MNPTTIRNADLGDLVELLRDQHARRVDIVAPASTLRSRDGVIHVKGADAEITEDGVTTVDGRYLPTRVFDEGLAEKLSIPLPYLRRLRETAPDLYDANVNGWLHGKKVHRLNGGPIDVVRPGDDRKFLFRAFRGDDGPGVARALLSDRYGVLDNFDVLTAALDGVRQAGVTVDIDGCDLTERRMYVRVVAPEVQALAPALLDGYRSPFWGDVQRIRQVAAREGQGYGEGNEPVVFAGFVISNSEVGNGAFSIAPRVVVKMCHNGLTIAADALRAVHLGGQLDAGIVNWSADTARKSLDLVTAKARDAVTTFLSPTYIEAQVAELSKQAGATVDKPEETIKVVGKALGYTQEQQDGILAHFIRGGQLTAGGVMQAVTSYAQVEPDADAAADLEASAVRVLELAARG